MISTAPIGLAVVDARTRRHVSANALYCELVGRSEAALFGTTPVDLGFPDAGSTSVERRHERPDGSVVWLNVMSTTLADASGAGAQLAYLVHDITARRLLDEADERRTLDALRDADRRKDEFLATLAHELRNPLGPIRNAAEIMRVAENDRAAISTARRMIERQLQQMVRLIDDLLDVSRITRGHVELRRERVSLGTILQLAIETSRPLIESRQHVLRVDAPPETLYLRGDPTRLAQVFANLLNNSAKYSEAGGLITVRVEPEGDQVTVTVADKGIGIEPEMLPRVFEMFTQAGRPGLHPQEGLGIGLTLVRRLVELHGGTVEARSEGIGHGSQFVVRLDLDTQPDTEQELSRGVADRQSDDEDDSDGLRILVADDNRDAAASLAMMLDLGGHEIRTAHDGIEAVKVADDFKPDLALLDIGMPRLDGYATARELRGRPWAKGLVLVALTGWGQDEDRRRSSDAGFDRHLVKPVDPAVLEQMLEDYMKKAAARPRA